MITPLAKVIMDYFNEGSFLEAGSPDSLKNTILDVCHNPFRR